MTSKYDPLRWHLESLTGDGWSATFVEIEQVLGFALPPSARKYRPWWANPKPGSGHPYASSWLDAGWKVDRVDFVQQYVTFFRADNAKEARSFQAPRTFPIDRNGIVAHSWDLLGEINCELRMRWLLVGAVVLGHGLLTFPSTLEDIPGLYRLQIRMTDRTERRYVGETVNLRQRFVQYRHAGTGQATNVRINRELRDAIEGGAQIALSIVTEDAWIIREGERQRADLSNVAVRRLFENFAQVVEGDGDVESLNR